MADIFRYLNRPRDEADYTDWLLGREAERADQPHWLEVPRSPTEDEFASAPPAPRTVTAKDGDNISKLIGTSNPSALGAFGRANGMRPGDSTIYPGRTYVVPNDGVATPDDRRGGLLMIGRDNSRQARIRAEREQAQAARAAQQREAELVLDETRYMPRYGHRESGESGAAVAPPAPSKPDLNTRLSKIADAAFARLPPEWNSDPMARAVASFLAREAGTNIGYATGALKTGGDIVKGGLFTARLFNPLDPLFHDKGDAAWDHVFGGIGSAIDYGASRAQDLGQLRQDVSDSVRQFREAHDPSATPQGVSLGDEVKRQFKIAKNDSELAIGVGSLLLPGAAFKGLGALGKAGELTGAAKWLAKGFTPAQADFLALPYDGIGHHYWPQAGIKLWKDANGKYVRAKLPKVLSDSPLNLRRPNISRGDFYELHYKVDPYFRRAGLPMRGRQGEWVGGGQFVGSRLGFEKYGRLGRTWYGSPTPLKLTAGATAVAPGLATYELTREDE